MEPKTIVAIVLVAFIIGGFIFLQDRKTRSKLISGETELCQAFEGASREHTMYYNGTRAKGGDAMVRENGEKSTIRLRLCRRRIVACLVN